MKLGGYLQLFNEENIFENTVCTIDSDDRSTAS
jgi:hypothetical protein